MPTNAALQEALLCLLCYDPAAAPIVAHSVGEDWDPVFGEIAKEAVDYLERYHVVPGEHTLDLVEGLARRDPGRANHYRLVLDSMRQTLPGLNRDYALERLSAHVRRQRFRRATATAARLLSSEDDGVLEEVAAAFSRAAQDGAATLEDLGLDLMHDVDATLAALALDQEQVKVPLSIPAFDGMGLGLSRQTLSVLVGLPKRGKSWWLLHLARMALTVGWSVLYLSLELSRGLIARRFVQSLFGLTRREGKVTFPRLYVEAEEVAWKLEHLEDRPHLDDPQTLELVRTRLTRRSRHPHFVVRDFPPKTLGLRRLRAYLDTLENRLRFRPDLILVDYPALMDLPGSAKEDLRIRLGQAFVELRGLAVQRHCHVAAVAQGSRAAKASRRLDERHVGEDFSIMGTVDQAFFFSQTEQEQKLGLARLGVMARDDEGSGFEVVIAQAYKMGQFVMSSARLQQGRGYHDTVRREGGG